MDAFKKIPALINSIGIATTSIALFSYAYLGFFSRYYADDYCMSGMVMQLGFWRAQVVQYMTWSNRYAGMFVLSLSDLFGLHAVRAWTGLVLVLWVFSLAWVMKQVNDYLRLNLSRGLLLLLAAMTVLTSILLSPQVYQSLFWRVGVITYTLPLVFLSLLVGLIFRFVAKIPAGNFPKAQMLTLLGLSFFGGGFSETYLTLQTGIFILALAAGAIFSQGSRKHSWLVLVGAGLTGSLISVLVVLLAPGNTARLAFMPATPHIFSLLRMTGVHTFLFLYETLDANPFQLLLAFFIPLFSIYIAFSGKFLPEWQPSRYITAFLCTGVLAALLVMGVMLPAAFAQSSYPDGRVLIEAAFIVAIAVVCAGGIVGLIFARLHQVSSDPVPAYLQVLVAAVLFVMLLYPVYMAQKNRQLIPEYRAAAAVWDRRDARIRVVRLEGAFEIEEKANNPPGGLGELAPNAEDWINVCAARFYDVKTITAGK